MIFTFLFLAMVLSQAQSPVPFWKSKSEIYKKMMEDRYVAVSAHTSDSGSDKKLSIVAAGIIHAPVEFSHDVIMKFAEYSKYLPYVVTTSFDKTTNNLFLHGAILGYHVQMTIHISVEKTGEVEKLKWKSVAGAFVGMEGVILEAPVDKDHTEISLDSSYVGKTIALPAFLLDRGLEFSAHRTASSMRSHIEDEWDASKKGNVNR